MTLKGPFLFGMTFTGFNEAVCAVLKRLDGEKFWEDVGKKVTAVIDVCNNCLNPVPLCGLLFQSSLCKG